MAEAAGTSVADGLPASSAFNEYSYANDVASLNGREHANAFSTKPRTSHDSSITYTKPSHKHSNPHAVNGKPSSRNSSRSRTRSRQSSATHDQRNLLPNRVDALGKKENSLSRTGSEPDSLLDLYGGNSANRSATSVMESLAEGKGDKAQGGDNNAYWIHRDKLAKIESEELQQLGINIPPSALSGSRHGRGRTRSRESHGNITNGSIDQTDRKWTDNDVEKRQWISSTGPVEHAAEEEETTNDESLAFDDPRLPEEIAEDPYEDGGGASAVYRMPVLRKSSSKIPVLSSTRLPLPQELLDRETPSPRSRNNTVTSGDDQAKSRRTSESAPRAHEPPEPAVPAETTPPPQSRSSPPASDPTPPQPTSPEKPPAKAANTTRKTSVPPNNRKPTGNQKSKATVNTSSTSNQRPKTRSGDRPQTAVNRPEGDPPWLATMYKPDPRLPPDQQILPTHARKLAQEQWEVEGKIPSSYDRDFAPLSVQGDNFGPPTPGSGKPQETSPPELKPPGPEMRKTPDLTNRPGTSGTDRYKTMPNIQPASNATVSSNTRPQPMEMDDSEPSKKKGCGCCVVM